MAERPELCTQQVSVVVPCYNECDGIESLAQTLDKCREKFSHRFSTHFILVNDGSTDNTHSLLIKHFGGRDGFLIINHGINRGIAAAIMTGIRASRSDVVVSMDSDCTYDPLTLDQLVDAMSDDIAMVTASPYHPHGRVVGVPAWRLWLSRQASKRYQKALGLHLHTYTSCFRAYRRSFFLDMELCDGGFVGIAEMLWLTARRGGKIVEVPAELTTRKVGFSKLRTFPVIKKHLALLRRIHRTPMTSSSQAKHNTSSFPLRSI